MATNVRARVRQDILKETAGGVAKAFEHHPHLETPGSWIEIMPTSVLPGMAGV